MDSPSCCTWRRGLLILVILGITLPPYAQGWSFAEETALRSSLASGYEEDVRPLEVTSIYMAFQMISLDEVNIRMQTFSVSGWWVLEWTDPRLTWTPASNGNIEMLQFYEDDVWTPAIVVSNSLTDLSAIDEDTIPLRVTYLGAVQWHPPGIFQTGCEMDTTHFPFDTQTCSMQVTSFGYTLDEVVVNSTKGLLLDFYTPSGDWEILEVSADYDFYYDSGNAYARMTYSVKIKRLNTYHWLNIIMPVIISGILIIFVFWLPVDSGEKMGYSLTCLLTYVVLLTLIAADMPTTAKHTSILEVYLTIILILSGFTVICCIVSIKLYQAGDDERIPRWVLVATKKCWPWVDWRKDSVKKSTQKDGRVHPENGNNYKKEPTVLSHRGFSEKEKGMRTPVRKLSVSSTISNDNDYSEDLIDGKVCSLVLDKVLFRIFVVFIPVLTLIFMCVLVSG